MPFPKSSELQEAILCFILLNGGPEHRVQSRLVYDLLADFFGLSPAERAEVRVRLDPSRGGRDTIWQNRVQWARSHNILKGLMTRPAADGSEWGIWALSPAGVQLAESVVNRYRALRQRRARSKHTN
jgi:hypothetical protein